MPESPKFELAPVGRRALRSVPALTIALALFIAALASSPFSVPGPTLFLLTTVVYAAAPGGWQGGPGGALIALLSLGWLLTDAGRDAQFEPLDRTLLMVGGVALPLVLLASWVLHRMLRVSGPRPGVGRR